MRIIEVTWGMAFKVWWSLIWRGLLFGTLVGVTVGVTMSLISFALGVKSLMFLTVLFSALIGIFVNIWIVRKVLYKRYSNFSVVCIANEN